MPIKTGQQYINSLRDGRRLFIDGKVVSDVTAYPPLQGVIGTIAGLYDDQHDPALQDILTYVSPTSGERVSATYLEARTPAEFAALAGCFHLRAKRTFGLMGGLPISCRLSWSTQPSALTRWASTRRRRAPRHGRALPRERRPGHPCADRSAVRPFDPRSAVGGSAGRRAAG
jgi:hypothetical protein